MSGAATATATRAPATNAAGLCCPSCGSRHIEQHDASGASVCTECGVVLEENAIVSSVEFVEGAGGASSMVGQFVSATASKVYTASHHGGLGGGGGGAGGGGRRYGFSRDSRETTLHNGRRRIQEVASRLRLGGHYVDAAHRLFTIAVEKNFVQGRRTTHVVAACLYIACRQEKSQHMLIDFSDALQINVYTLGTCFLKFRRLLGLPLEILDPALYVYRFAAHLELDDKANAVALTALRLVGRMKRDWIVAGRRPAGICAAALLIAARAHGFSRHPQDVTRILRVCGLTVSTRVKEFEQTPTAQLTLDQFSRGVEFQTEADPPVFTRNRILEARARAIQEGDVDLLTSGALDDPLKAGQKSATKWRSHAIDPKKARFDELYQALEHEMATAKSVSNASVSSSVSDKKEDSSSSDVSGPQGDTENGGGSDTEGGASIPREEMNQQGDTEKDDGSDGDRQKPPRAVASEKTTTTSPAELIAANRKASSAASEQQLVTVSSQWAQAYPKSKLGKDIILPDHATPEERMPPTAPVEDSLDMKEWKDEMPRELIEDIESLLHSPTEVAQKEAIFNKRNKDYIELQAQKEKNRASAEEAHTQQEQEMVEQFQGQERYRKRKNRARGGVENTSGDTAAAAAGGDGVGVSATATTTEEALLLAVANRKISRKINYDAMSAIFDQDGTFATEDGVDDIFGREEDTTESLMDF